MASNGLAWGRFDTADAFKSGSKKRGLRKSPALCTLAPVALNATPDCVVRRNLAHCRRAIWVFAPVFEGPASHGATTVRKVFERVVTLLKGGERQEAESLCRDALARDPGDINFVSLLGSILASRGAHQEAVELLQRAVRTTPGHAQAQEDLGTLYLNLDRAEEALPCLERARELRPPHAPLFSKLSAA